MRRSIRAALGGIAAACAVASAVQAADLPRRQAPPPAVPAPPVFTWTVFTWTGFHVGANAGYGFRDSSGSVIDPTTGASVTGSGGRGGFAGGGQIGYTYQLTPGSGFVVGVEADIQGMATAKANAAYLGTTPYYNLSPRPDYFGTVRGRAGYAFDRVLIYGTGGFAYSGGSNAAHAGAYPYTLPGTTRTGYAVGGGIEYAVTQSLSAKIEALYVGLGRRYANPTSFDATSAAYYGVGRTDPSFTVVRAGLNYRF